nr:MAG TPA: hypothetical protein [Caudoviricetes sp.]
MTRQKKNDSGRVEVFLPRGSKNDDANLFVSVNGKSYLLPRGKVSLVPPEVAAEIARSGEALERLDATVERMLAQTDKPLQGIG